MEEGKINEVKDLIEMGCPHFIGQEDDPTRFIDRPDNRPNQSILTRYLVSMRPAELNLEDFIFLVDKIKKKVGPSWMPSVRTLNKALWGMRASRYCKVTGGGTSLHFVIDEALLRVKHDLFHDMFIYLLHNGGLQRLLTDFHNREELYPSMSDPGVKLSLIGNNPLQHFIGLGLFEILSRTLFNRTEPRSVKSRFCYGLEYIERLDNEFSVDWNKPQFTLVDTWMQKIINTDPKLDMKINSVRGSFLTAVLMSYFERLWMIEMYPSNVLFAGMNLTLLHEFFKYIRVLVKVYGMKVSPLMLGSTGAGISSRGFIDMVFFYKQPMRREPLNLMSRSMRFISESVVINEYLNNHHVMGSYSVEEFRELERRDPRQPENNQEGDYIFFNRALMLNLTSLSPNSLSVARHDLFRVMLGLHTIRNINELLKYEELFVTLCSLEWVPRLWTKANPWVVRMPTVLVKLMHVCLCHPVLDLREFDHHPTMRTDKEWIQKRVKHYFM